MNQVIQSLHALAKQKLFDVTRAVTVRQVKDAVREYLTTDIAILDKLEELSVSGALSDEDSDYLVDRLFALDSLLEKYIQERWNFPSGDLHSFTS